MFNSARAFIFALTAGIAGTAFAADAYYDVPVRELELTEGEFPARKEITQWRPYSEMERLRAMRPYAVLDGEGEVYVVGRGEPRDTWYSHATYLAYAVPASEKPADSTHSTPDPLAPLASLASITHGNATRVFVCSPEGKDVSGRLYVPNAELTGMIALKFIISATTAKKEAKMPFLWVKNVHYDLLHNRDIPGGAWFRYQARLARSEMNLTKDTHTAATFPRRSRRDDDLTRTYELFTGGRAVSENLQLDRALPELQPNETPVKIDTLDGITIREIDWKELIGDARPELDPLAAKIPADQHVLFFPSFRAALAVADEAERHDTPVLRLARPRSEDAHVVERYQRQLGLPISKLARLLGPKVVNSVALTGSDPYYPLGTDVAVLFETPRPAALEKLLLGKVALAAAAVKGANPAGGEIDGLKYRGFATPDRHLSSYVARLDGAVAVSNSTHQLARLAEVKQGEAKSIAALPEYKFFRIRYPLGAADETALLFISDPTIRRWCGPRWRIGDSRRTRARAVMADVQAAQLDPLVNGAVRPGPVHTAFPTPGDELAIGPSGVVSSTYGTLEFMTPIAEIPLEEVAKAEAESYRRWRDGYQRNWSWAFDPIALKIGLDEKRLSADLSVMPLIMRTEYADFMSIALGGKFEPTDGDRHDALVQLIMAIDHDSRMFRQGNNFASMMGKAVSLGWIGRWVNVYADDDPFWRELAEVEPDKVGEFMETNAGRIPVAVRFDVSNPLKLAAFLTSARAFIEQTSPGLTQWESLKYREQPYVRVTPNKNARDFHDEYDNVNVYYTAIDNALTITLSEKVLRGAIDRSLDRRKTDAGENAHAAAPRPWLGSNVALRVDDKVLDVVNALARRKYQRAMQIQCWENLPILNQWKRLYPDRDPVEVHRLVWGVELVCPGGGRYAWNDKYRTMESTVYGHPGEPREGPPAPPVLGGFTGGDFGLTFEHQGLRARARLDRPAPAKPGENGD